MPQSKKCRKRLLLTFLALTMLLLACTTTNPAQPGISTKASPDKLVAGKLNTIFGDSLLTPDDSTVQIITNKKVSYFLDALSYSCSYVVEKSLVDKYGIHFTDHLTEGGGAGPWKV